MQSNEKKTFVGFGFGPIQSGLFLFEAYNSNNFSRFVVAEIDDTLIEAVRKNNGRYTINIARFDKIDKFTLEGIEIYNPQKDDERAKLIDAIATSDEIATALPSVKIYNAGGKASVVNIISEGISKRTDTMPTIIYTAENHNHAAEILQGQLAELIDDEKLKQIQTLNTVIGKMSGVISETNIISEMKLTTITPDIPRAILVEEFNKILISKIRLSDYHRGIEVFIEKENLLPFEEAKLYGHNAIHAVIAYLADLRNYKTIAQAGKDEQIMQIARNAFIDESGAALVKKYKHLGDELFTEAGYREYAEDLLRRMTNPNLNDLVWRVGRDHVRKLGYDDRIFGTMRIALQYGIEPKNLAMGAAAGIISMIKRRETVPNIPSSCPENIEKLNAESIRNILLEIWNDSGAKEVKAEKTKIEQEKHEKTEKTKEKLISLTTKAFDEISEFIR